MATCTIFCVSVGIHLLGEYSDYPASALNIKWRSDRHRGARAVLSDLAWPLKKSFTSRKFASKESKYVFEK
jgi:hypothetical protein